MKLFLMTLLLGGLTLWNGRAADITKIEGRVAGWDITTRRSVCQLRLLSLIHI